MSSKTRTRGAHRASRSSRGWVVLALGAFVAAALAFIGPASASTPTVTYTGQGFTVDESGTPNLNDERCGLTGQNNANDGSTGQFANWNGPGQPYQTGQGYLVWVLSLNTGKNTVPVTLHLPDGEVNMIKVGGTYKYASQYYNYADLVGFPVHATFSGSSKNVQLVVSHGCKPFTTEGAWCSPGYWMNADDAAWALTGYSRTDPFNTTVVPDFYDTAYAPDSFRIGNGPGATFISDPTLDQVLDNPGGVNATVSGPFNINQFNATGAFLTDNIPGFDFDPSLIGNEEACPIDNHGNYK